MSVALYRLFACHLGIQVSANNGLEGPRSLSKPIQPILVDDCVMMTKSSSDKSPSSTVNINFQMNSTKVDSKQSIWLLLSHSLGLCDRSSSPPLIGYSLEVFSEETLENATFYMSIGETQSNCPVNKTCLVQGEFVRISVCEVEGSKLLTSSTSRPTNPSPSGDYKLVK